MFLNVAPVVKISFINNIFYFAKNVYTQPISVGQEASDGQDASVIGLIGLYVNYC